MGALPTIKRFLAEDYPTEAGWIGPLLYSLNLLLTTIYSNLNNGMTIGQNSLAQINTVSVNGSSPTTSFLWKFNSNPVGIEVINVTGAVPSGAVFCLFVYSAGVVTITNVFGLKAGSTYNITFHVIGG